MARSLGWRIIRRPGAGLGDSWGPIAQEENLQRKMWLLMLPLCIYLLLWGAAVAYAVYKESYDAAHSEFAGLPLIVLGLPWSFVWHGFNPKVIESQYYNSVIVSSIFILFNAVIILLVSILVFVRIGRSR